MRRALLALVIAAGLAIGTVIPTSALGLTQVTLSCDDGTSWTAVVDTDTLTGLVASVQAMLDYPAGLTCTLIQTPVVGLGGIAQASSDPFIVAGGRWQLPCSIVLGVFGGGVEPGIVARAPGAWYSVSSVDLSQIYVWINVALNAHTNASGQFGTLNETIPNQSCGDIQVGESHFTSKVVCYTTPTLVKDPVYVTSHVSQFSGQVPFLSAGGTLTGTPYLHFAFQDNANPPGQNPMGVPSTDLINGPPATLVEDPAVSTCTNGVPPLVDTQTGLATYHLGAFDGSKQYGNITTHP